VDGKSDRTQRGPGAVSSETGLEGLRSPTVLGCAALEGVNGKNDGGGESGGWGRGLQLSSRKGPGKTAGEGGLSEASSLVGQLIWGQLFRGGKEIGRRNVVASAGILFEEDALREGCGPAVGGRGGRLFHRTVNG